MARTFRDKKKRDGTLPMMAYYRKKIWRKFANKKVRREIKHGLEIKNHEYKKVFDVQWTVL